MSSNSFTRRAAVTGALGVSTAGVLATPAHAHASGPSPQDALDLAAIRSVVDGIDDAVDTKDWPRCREYFTDVVAVDFTALDGGRPGSMPADQLVDAWRHNLYAEKASFHSRTNHEIELSGNQASVRSKGYAFNRLTRRLGDDLWEVWAHYGHELVRTPDGWRCSAIALTSVTHARGNELVRTFVPED